MENKKSYSLKHFLNTKNNQKNNISIHYILKNKKNKVLVCLLNLDAILSRLNAHIFITTILIL